MPKEQNINISEERRQLQHNGGPHSKRNSRAK